MPTRDQILNDLRQNLNAYRSMQLQGFVNANTISREDLVDAFGQDEADKIMQSNGPVRLPMVDDDLTPLTSGCTEVYFWGATNTGKTCLMGVLLACLQQGGNFHPEAEGNAIAYRDALSDIFSLGHPIITLPESSATANVPKMVFTINKSISTAHHIAIVDFGGEVLQAVYNHCNGAQLTDSQQVAFKHAKSFLTGRKSNRKLHFFVIEYEGHGRKFDIRQRNGHIVQVSMVRLLDIMINFFNNNNVFDNSDGLYVIVTKCDRLHGENENGRRERASRYVDENFRSFYNVLDTNATKYSLPSPVIFPFSIGKVFAQDFVYNNRYPDGNSIIDQIQHHCPKERGCLDVIRRVCPPIYDWLKRMQS